VKINFMTNYFGEKFAEPVMDEGIEEVGISFV